ncbi:unnamed protein product [Onchocerca flexuosa]|uniref:EB domain-containing protein n=1 Tax=Onchocerca flexuosa TaxID=387005 RepID=A0A183HKZ1_9BILA|nr:unnamed protein product [Onchocerca flexuosa]
MHYFKRTSGKIMFQKFLKNNHQNACYDTLRIRSEPETCTHSTDCYDTNAECIYSLAESRHICCKPRPNAIFPECPDGRKILIMGKYMPVLCSLENSIENDMCPEGYECLPSVTTFTRNNEQSYNICCKII